MRGIWSGMQSDKLLLDLELQESRIAAQMLTRAMLRVFPSADPQQVNDAAFLVWQLGESSMRLAISCSAEEATTSHQPCPAGSYRRETVLH